MYTQNQNEIRPRRLAFLDDNEHGFKHYHNIKIGKHIKIPDDFVVFTRDSNKEVTKSKMHNFKEYASKGFATFCDKTSLHGLKYVGDPTLTYFERFFWLVAFGVAFAFSAYFILLIYEKYDKSPVIVSFNPVTVPVNSIPFPSVTICNLNQAVKSHAERIQRQGSDMDKKLLEDFCNFNGTEDNGTSTVDETITWSYVRKFITDISQPCSDIFRFCMWKRTVFDCEKYIQTYFTDDGLCCTFNQLPPHLILKNRDEGDTTNLSIIDWSPERGYTLEDPISFLPWRQEGPGSHLGLTVAVNAAVEDFFCSSSFGIGFKIVMSNPIDTPRMADYGFLVNPGIESRIVIVPSIKDATETLRSIDVEKRQCFFHDERWLRYYKLYTQRHCELECQTNFTLKECGCIPYFLPKEINATICGKKKEACVGRAKELMSSLTSIEELGISCNCLAGCYDITYASEVTYGNLKAESVPPFLLSNTSTKEFLKNTAILRFFFNKSTFRKQTKSELFGFSEFLSSTGGLLGLFLGFSFLSAVEVGYYFFLRAICNLLNSTRAAKKQNNSPKKVLYPYYN